MTLLGSFSAWHERSPMLDMVGADWRKLGCRAPSRASSRPSSAPRRPASAQTRLTLPLWRPELELKEPKEPKEPKESKERPKSAPLRSASQPLREPPKALPVPPAPPQPLPPQPVNATPQPAVKAMAPVAKAVQKVPKEKPRRKKPAPSQLCQTCHLAAGLVVQTQCGDQIVTADFDNKEERRRRARSKAELTRPSPKPRRRHSSHLSKVFKEGSEELSWSITVLSSLQTSSGKNEMERFTSKLKELEDQMDLLDDLPTDLGVDVDDLMDVQPKIVKRKESISMMRRWSRSISPMEEELQIPRQGSRRTALPTALPGALLEPRSRSESKSSLVSSGRCSARNAVMAELDGLLDLKKDPIEDGFSQAEVQRLHAAFKRFQMPETIDIHKDDIFELLEFLGCVFLDQETVRSLLDTTTRFDHVGFDDFEAFMGKYSKYCQEQYRVIFDEFDEDDSGTISMEELRQMTHSLGFMPTRVMVEEAIDFVGRSRRPLSFDELVRFLMLYRLREGFCRKEVDMLRDVHKEYSDGDPLVMPVAKLSAACVQAFGRQVTHVSEQLQERILSGQYLRSLQVAPGPDFEPEKLSFSEFLILCRNCREALHCKMDSLWPSDEPEKPRELPGLAIKCNPRGEGTIDDAELRSVLRGLGYMPLTKAMLDIYLEVIGSPIPRDLDYDEFFDFVWRFRTNCGFSKEELSDMMELYNMSDEDGSGEICSLELGSIFRSLGYKANMEQLTGLLLEVDTDQSGFLGFSEFKTLMGDFRTAELKKIHKVFEEFAIEGYLHGEAITDACRKMGRRLIDGRHAPEEDDEFDLEDFVDWVDECRHDAMMRERKLAGFGYWKVECYRESFKEFDRNGNGVLEPDELIKFLRYLKISEAPKTKEDQKAIIKLVEVARKNAYECGIREAYLEEANNVSFWTFVQLLRLLQTQKDRRLMVQLDDLMEELRFSKFEVEQFRQVFAYWARYDPNTGLAEREIDLEVDMLTEEQVCRIFRSAGVSLVGGNMGKLRVGLEPLQVNGKLSFHNFLKLMRWVVDNNFSGLSQVIPK